MAEPRLPEVIIAQIFARLPIKPLIRFTCLSKRWQFIILFDQQFAKSQFQIACQQQTVSRRLLFNARESESVSESQLRSLDLGDDISSDISSSLRKHRCPFLQSDGIVTYSYMSSSNGLVCLFFSRSSMYLWNPTTGFYRKLPLPDFFEFTCLGFGYVSSTDDYKILGVSFALVDLEKEGFQVKQEYKTWSLRANIWNKIEAPTEYDLKRIRARFKRSTLFNEALHWYNDKDIVVFDLAKEEFRTMHMPASVVDNQHVVTVGVSLEGCLCLLAFTNGDDFADLWLMREYDVTDSWTKQFSFKISAPNRITSVSRLVSDMETCTFVITSENFPHTPIGQPREYIYRLIRSGHEEEVCVEICMVNNNLLEATEYQETLFGIPQVIH